MLALKEFSLAAPYVLDPEHLMDAVALLEEFGWNAENAARHIGNRTMLDFDEAMMEKGDDPFGEAGENPFPGPAG
ncbi:MAG: hypothetical protein GC192_21220 [Bacteroidetes bacterium]|nr:hypothetical protein [Bacteroidota bacterium]